MTANQAAEALGLAYNTAARYLSVLTHQGKIKVSHCESARRVFVPFDAPVRTKESPAPAPVAKQPAESEMPTDGRIMSRWVGGNPFKKAMA
jgi:hypothetical protein